MMNYDAGAVAHPRAMRTVISAIDARSRVHDRRLRAARQRQKTKRGGGFTGAVRRASKGASSLTRAWTDEPTPAFCRAVEPGAGCEGVTESRRTTALAAGRRRTWAEGGPEGPPLRSR